ncbi:TonB-denpendent receptor [Asticcacaulis sp. AC460]|uniref:TonB-dependent receptor n=1 Tax=Asticcacaulis sp. AC460 TaxID=1282360 RepID=UPI0003C3C247|nr:TonB-dependent receptor [Asticcacaulis sp. AC460]ESQ88265.1 TonB-denpendent receptor [Asticcacaulis sp. AC460]
MKSVFKRALIASAALTVTSLGLAAPAFAQDSAPEAAAADDGVVVVTARRRDETLKAVPIAVSSFTAEKLGRTGAPDITSLQQQTPNLTLQVARGSNSTLIAFIRGVGQQDPLWGFEPGVGLYVDDVYIARPQGAVLDIYDIQRIEVLRGPQGTLYGRNTIGGAVKYVTKPLGHETALTAKAVLGSYNNQDITLSGALPLGDTFTVGAAVASLKHDGYGTNLNTGAEHYNKDVLAYRLSADWTPTDDFTARFNYDNYTDNSAPRHGHRETTAKNAFGGTLYTGANAHLGLPTESIYDTYAGIGDDNKVVSDGASATLEYRVNDTWTVKSITAVRKGHTDTVIDFDGTPRDALDVQAYYGDSQASQEFQVLYSGEHWSTVAGLYYLNSTAEGAFDTRLGTYDAYAALGPIYAKFANGLTALTAGKVRTQSWAAFFDSSIRVNDKLSFSVGGRYTEDHKTGSVYKANYYGRRSPAFGGTTFLTASPDLKTSYANDRTFSAFTPRVSVSYNFTGDLTGYVSASSGFKSGGFDMRGDASVTPSTVNGYKPEYVVTQEIGLKGSMFGKRLNFAADIFSSKYTDVQITRQTTVGSTVASQVENAGKAHMSGAEFEGTFRFSPNLTASATIGYIDAKYDEFLSYNVTTGVTTNIAGAAKFQNTPEWTNSFGLTWRSQVAGGQLVIAPQASYRSDQQQFEFALPALDQPAFWLYDLGASWTAPSGHYKVGVYGRNLTDEQYRVGGYNFPANGFGNSVTAFYGPPKTFLVSLEYKY